MQTEKHDYRRLLPITLLILISIVLGLATVRDYGQSWDEGGNLIYGRHSIQNYANLFQGNPVVDYHRKHLDEKGPVFFMLADLSGRVVTALFPNWLDVNVWHFDYFLAFEASVLCLYFLARRWSSEWAAFGVALLFCTQPVLWGHAFINPKDIPFMAFFLISVTTGFYTMDALLVSPTAEEKINPYLRFVFHELISDWRSASQKTKQALGIFSACAALIAVVLYFGKGYFDGLLGQFILQAYSADKDSWLRGIFQLFAQSAGNTPVEYYLEKIQAVWQVLWAFLLVLAVVSIAWRIIVSLDALRAGTKDFFRDFFAALRNPRMLAAAILLGLTVSIRILGPLAGVLVALYALDRSFKRALPVLTGYAIIAIINMFVTWPYLWAAPVGHFFSVLKLMSQYPWTLSALFNGTFYAPNQLPWNYLPVMFLIQLTEPLLLLILVGFLLVVIRFKKYFTSGLLALGIWFFVPVVTPILLHSTLYDNFRQFFFVLPPLFVLAAIGLDVILNKLKFDWLKAVFFVVMALPGIYAGFMLHPYEYVYYNSIVGGTAGAFRRFDIEYWGTSYKEAAEMLNQVAPANTRVLVYGPDEIFDRYARPDLKVYNTDDAKQVGGSFDYLVTLTRWNKDLLLCPQEKTIASIERNEAVFTVIKQLSGNSENCP